MGVDFSNCLWNAVWRPSRYEYSESVQQARFYKQPWQVAVLGSRLAHRMDRACFSGTKTIFHGGVDVSLGLLVGDAFSENDHQMYGRFLLCNEDVFTEDLSYCSFYRRMLFPETFYHWTFFLISVLEPVKYVNSSQHLSTEQQYWRYWQYGVSAAQQYLSRMLLLT